MEVYGNNEQDKLSDILDRLSEEGLEDILIFAKGLEVYEGESTKKGVPYH